MSWPQAFVYIAAIVVGGIGATIILCVFICALSKWKSQTPEEWLKEIDDMTRPVRERIEKEAQR